MTLVSIPKSDADDLDDVIRLLAIEDSETTPAEAVAELLAEIARLRSLRTSHDRLLAAATLVVDAAEDPDSASGDVALSIENLHAAITSAEELTP